MAYKKMGSSLRLTLNGVKSTVDPCSKLKKWGHPLKGLSREKTPLPTKKIHLFFACPLTFAPAQPRFIVTFFRSRYFF
ncbi:MAG: hypothetical protein K8R09_02895, partial [Desulfobacterales bacterium]|nr:hypothetical protein [Desulfobacterales bacterium]